MKARNDATDRRHRADRRRREERARSRARLPASTRGVPECRYNRPPYGNHAMPYRLVDKQLIYVGKRVRLEIHHLDDDDTGRRVSKEVVVHPVFDAVRYQYLGEQNGGSISHHVPALQVAEAVVRDYVDAKMCVFNGEEPEQTAKPGLASFEGSFSADEVKTRFPKEIELLFKQQINWFLRLVQYADDEWTRYQNHKVITDEERLAANCLKLERDWNIDVSKAAYIKCQFCQTSISIAAIICPSCKEIVKPETYKKLHINREALLSK